MGLGDSAVSVFVFVIAIVLLFVFPLMSVSERNDDIAQITVQTETSEFGEEITLTGKITEDRFQQFTDQLSATGHSYDIEIEIKKLDENPGKKVTWDASNRVGENLYYSILTADVLEQLRSSTHSYTLKKGDMIVVTVKNTDQTLAQMIRSVFYKISGSESYQVKGSFVGTVVANGK